MTLAIGEGDTDQVLDGASGRSSRDIHLRQRGMEHHTATDEVFPDGELVLSEARLELLDPVTADVEDDAHSFHDKLLSVDLGRRRLIRNVG
jgi:hypothetical protein